MSAAAVEPSSLPVALVTGSSSGIGAAIARRLTGVGYAIVINSVSSMETGKALAARLPNASYVQADVADRKQAGHLVTRTLETYGRLDLLINNAATTRLIPLDDIDGVTDEVWHEVLDVNLLGVWHMVQAAVPALRRANGNGHIINISSYASLRPITSSLPYAVSKAALNHLTALLAAVLGPEIRVNALAPGFVETRWTADWESIRASVSRRAPARRPGVPEDVADACLGLVDSSYVTGCVLPVDGGLHLR